MIIPIRVSLEMFERLADQAERARRPVTWQAEIILERALGLSPDASKDGHDDVA